MYVYSFYSILFFATVIFFVVLFAAKRLRFRSFVTSANVFSRLVVSAFKTILPPLSNISSADLTIYPQFAKHSIFTPPLSLLDQNPH